MVDESVLLIIIEEALSNARKHRQPHTPIEVRVSLRGESLTVEVKNVLKAGAKPITEEDCVQAFQPGVKSRMADPSSDGVGLDSVMLCANAVNGLAELSAAVDDAGLTYTIFRVVMPATAPGTTSAPASPAAGTGGRQADVLPVARCWASRPSHQAHAPPAASTPAPPQRTQTAAANNGDSLSQNGTGKPTETVVASGADVGADPPPLPPNLRVLIVDDIKVNRTLLSSILRRVDPTWRVAEAVSGEEALQRLLEQAELYDLIVMDEHFVGSEMLGTDVVRQLRAADVCTPIVSCSGNAAQMPNAAMNNKFWEAGADLVWSKPLPSWRDGSLQAQLRQVL